MMTPDQKERLLEAEKTDADGVRYATIEEYGYKRHVVGKKIWKIFTDIVVVLTVIMLYLSIIIIMIQSVNSSTIVSSFKSFTLKWYGEIFQHRALLNAIKNTFIVSILATLLSTILGTIVAVGIHYLSPKRRQTILLLNNIPLLNADIVTGISLMLIFSLLLPIFPYLFGWKTMLIAHMFFTLPYVVLSVLPKLKELDSNSMDAALDLGLRPFKAMFKIIVPAIKSGILSGMILAFTMSFDDFVVSYYTTGNGFDNLSIWIYGSIGRKSLTPSVYAFSTVVTFGSMLVLLLANFFINKKKEKKNAKI
jgi:spermidine/putrescine transport system permease protein